MASAESPYAWDEPPPPEMEPPAVEESARKYWFCRKLAVTVEFWLRLMVAVALKSPGAKELVGSCGKALEGFDKVHPKVEEA